MYFTGGISRSTDSDQLSVSPRAEGERGVGGGGSGMVAGDSSTLGPPGSGLLNVSKSHKRSRSEGAIHRVITERYMSIFIIQMHKKRSGTYTSTCTCMIPYSDKFLHEIYLCELCELSTGRINLYRINFYRAISYYA